jgi:hypothetical protein
MVFFLSLFKFFFKEQATLEKVSKKNGRQAAAFARALSFQKEWAGYVGRQRGVGEARKKNDMSEALVLRFLSVSDSRVLRRLFSVAVFFCFFLSYF